MDWLWEDIFFNKSDVERCELSNKRFIFQLIKNLLDSNSNRNDEPKNSPSLNSETFDWFELVGQIFDEVSPFADVLEILEYSNAEFEFFIRCSEPPDPSQRKLKNLFLCSCCFEFSKL